MGRPAAARLPPPGLLQRSTRRLGRRQRALKPAVKKTLPIAAPPVYCYLHHAFPLAIMATRDDYLSWFLSHFLQLSCPADLPIESIAHDRAFKLDFFIHPLYNIEHPHYNQFVSPWLNSTWLDWRLLAASGESPTRFLIDCIDRNLYVELSVDMYFVRGSGAYGHRHIAHEIVVYGYDDDVQMFDTAIGFDRNGAFAAMPIPFAEVARAVTESDLRGHYIERGIGLFEYLGDNHSAFDLAWVRTQLADYYHGRDTGRRFPAAPSRRRHVFGSEIYRILHQYLDYLVEQAIRPDIRPLHLLWEHKKCLRARVAYMEHAGHLDPALAIARRCTALEQQADHLRLVMLRNLQRRSATSAQHIGAGLKTLAHEERLVLETLLAHLPCPPASASQESIQPQ